MELSRQEYPALAGLLQPNQAVAVVNGRLTSINKTHQDIADWLQERRRLEEAYCLGLRKLARRPQPETGAGLGIFDIPWRRILSATEYLAQSHENLAQQIEADVERPLREYGVRSQEMKAMSGIHHDLASLAKSLDAAQKKAAKFRDKGPKAADKYASAASAAQEVKAQWESRLPFVFEKLQDVDEHRINHLRDVLTQLQTHESDHIERNRTSTESCLNALLAADTAEEIRTFALMASGGRTAELESRLPPATASSHPESGPAEPLQPPPRLFDEAGSRRSSNSGAARPSFATEQPPNPQQRHTPLGGLKRLGTVMSRRRSIVQPSPGHSSPEKKHRSPFIPFRRSDSSRSFHQVDSQPSPVNGLAPVRSHDESSIHRPGSSTTGNASVPEHHIDTVLNGAAIAEEPSGEVPAEMSGSARERPISPKQSSVDTEGFSTKPSTIDEISRIQQESVSNEDPGLKLTIRDQPIQEDEGEAQNALNEMASTLRLQAKQSGLSRGPGTLRGRRDVRNTIFLPNPLPSETEERKDSLTTSIPETVGSSISPSQTPHIPSQSGTAQDDYTISDVTSIHSSHTLHSMAGPISHPELFAPGLNASIVEKLNAFVSDGIVTKAFVVGELALAYNPSDGPSQDRQIVRLDNFQVLERVAANPQFVSEIETDSQSPGAKEDRKGEYSIGLSSLRGPAPTVAFKYQIHLDHSNQSAYCPVIFNPVWNEQNLQASVIIYYSLNPQFVSSRPLTSITLQNIVLTVGLDLSPIDEETKEPREVARASGAAMHPNVGASFRRKTSSVIWRLPELEVSVEGTQNRFLARFSTAAGRPRKGKVEAKFDVVVKDIGLRLGISSSQPISQGEAGMEAMNGSAASHVATWTELPTQRKLSAARYVAI